MKHLQKLISPYNPNEFHTQYFEKKHLHISRQSPNYFDKYLSYQRINELISGRNLFPNDVRMVKLINNEVESVRISPEGKNIVDTRLITKHFLDGYTLVLNALHKQIPELWDLSSAMSNYFGCMFQTNIYITPGQESQGFNVHHDTHDVFIMQISGEKKWEFYESPVPLANTDIKFKPGEHVPGKKIDELTMKPGDFLYVPRGLMHCATTTTDMSIHITGGLMNNTVKELLIERLSAATLNDVRLRKTFPPGYWNNEPEDQLLNDIQAILKDVTSKDSIKEGLNNLREFCINSMPNRVASPLVESHNVNSINNHSKLRIHPNLSYVVEYDANELHVKMFFQTMSLPIDFKPIIEFITSKESFEVCELPDLMEEEDKIAFIQSLVIEGFLTTQSE